MARPLLYPVRLNVRISKETEAALRRIEQRLGTNTSEAIRASIEHLEKWVREQKKRKG